MTDEQPHAIRLATAADLAYVVHEARRHSNAIGFVPRTALADHIDRRNVRLLTINGQAAGYLLSGGGKLRPYRLIQVAITTELWRLGYGSILIGVARRMASNTHCPAMSATVRDGLPMMRVATATGASKTATRDTHNARKRVLHDYLWPSIPRLLTIANCQSVLDSLTSETNALQHQRPTPGPHPGGGNPPRPPMDRVEELFDLPPTRGGPIKSPGPGFPGYPNATLKL